MSSNLNLYVYINVCLAIAKPLKYHSIKIMLRSKDRFIGRGIETKDGITKT